MSSTEAVPKISSIFPIFNDGQNLSLMVERADTTFAMLCMAGEVILTDDGSSDDSSFICNKLAMRYANVRVISHETNLGYGAALQSGFVAATMPVIFFTDSDGQFDLCDIFKLLPYVNNYDMVLGYRDKRNDPWYRKVNSTVGNFLARLLFGIQVRDINCAFKIFRREFIQSIEIESEGAMVNTEILAKAKKMGCTYIEVPVHHYPRLHGKPTGANVGVILKTFKEGVHLWRRMCFS